MVACLARGCVSSTNPASPPKSFPAYLSSPLPMPPTIHYASPLKHISSRFVMARPGLRLSRPFQVPSCSVRLPTCTPTKPTASHPILSHSDPPHSALPCPANPRLVPSRSNPAQLRQCQPTQPTPPHTIPSLPEPTHPIPACPTQPPSQLNQPRPTSIRWRCFRYPSAIDGVIAGSAPIESFLGETPPYDPGSYAKGVTYDASVAGGASAGCEEAVRAAWSAIFR